MTSKEFVAAFYKEKQDLLQTYLHSDAQTETSQLIQSLHLTPQQTEILKQVLDVSFSDIFYTILLGLDGATSIGNVQESYTILDEDNNELTGGEIEGFAWEYFQKDK